MDFDTGIDGMVYDGAFEQWGTIEPEDTGKLVGATIDLQFRLATNGVIVNTIVDDEPLFTTSAGTFN